MKDYRITVKVRNNRILKAIEAVGGTPGNKWCEANGLGYGLVNDLINLTASPIGEYGDLRPTAARLCEVLGVLPDDLWSNEQLHPLERNFSYMEMDHSQVLALSSSGGGEQAYLPDFSAIDQRETRALLDKAKARLTEREREVIALRYEKDLSLQECAKILKYTVERIRQIESKALRKLRHPSSVAIFLDALDISPEKREMCQRDAERWGTGERFAYSGVTYD